MAVTGTSLTGFHEQPASALQVMHVPGVLNWGMEFYLPWIWDFAQEHGGLRMFVAMAGNDSAICIDLSMLLLIFIWGNN